MRRARHLARRVSPELRRRHSAPKRPRRRVRARRPTIPQNPKRADFDFPLYDAATPHQQKVRRAVRDIPPGETASYGDIARAAKTSPRAVGGACRANALPLIVPCHRVVAANNNIGGFMGDNQTNCVDIKRQLLAHEGVRL